jgi:hypothetical protein
MNALNGWILSANAWLRGSFLAPAMLAFLALIPLVILLYLLKLRRTEVEIPSTLLWMRSLHDMTANAPFQRLRKNLLLLLQIIVLMLLATGLARPYLQAEGTAGNHLCVLIDRSASMQTLEDGEKTRMDLAKEEIGQMIDEMEGGDQMMLVDFAETSNVLCELTDDRSRLRAALRSVETADTRTRIRDAILVAHSLKQTIPDLDIVVVGDGNVSDLNEMATRAYDLSFLRVGEATHNLGIVAFSVRAPLGGSGGDRQTFALVHNAYKEPVTTTLTLSFGDDVLAIEEITVPAEDSAETVFVHPDLGAGVLQAELDYEDALAVDNVAWLALRPDSQIRALLVSAPDSVSAYMLRQVLALDPRVALSTSPPENYQMTDEYDLTLFDNYVPEVMPAGTLVFLNVAPQIDGVEVTGSIDNPPIIARDTEHPLMRFNLDPSNVIISKALQLKLPADAPSLVSTAGSPLIADLSRGGRQILLIGFDIADSNWPLNLSFPLFFQNLLAWVPRSALAAETSVAAGRPLTLSANADFETATVRGPNGKSAKLALDPMRSVYFSGTERTGVYEVEVGDTTLPYAVNVLDRSETAIRPAEALELGRAKVEAVEGSVRQNKELWTWFLIGALVFLCAEWWIFSRRAWA